MTKHKTVNLHTSDNVVIYVFIAYIYTFKAHNIIFETSPVVTIYESYKTNFLSVKLSFVLKY